MTRRVSSDTRNSIQGDGLLCLLSVHDPRSKEMTHVTERIGSRRTLAGPALVVVSAYPTGLPLIRVYGSPRPRAE